MVSSKDVDVYRRDARSRQRALSAEQRESLVEPYLPPVPEDVVSSKSGSERSTSKKPRKKPIRSFLKVKFHSLVYFAVHLIFSIYLRLRQTYHAVVDRFLALLYYHHRTPELIQRDVKNLSQLPEHLSAIVSFRSEEDGGVEALMEDVAELSAWSASAGIPLLSVYEKTGVLKSNMRAVHAMVSQRLMSYFGSSSALQLRLHTPNRQSISAANADADCKTLDLVLLSSSDGRDTLVDLTRTLAEMAQSNKLHPGDITQDLINAELSATTSIPAYSPPLSPPTSPPLSPKATSSVPATAEPDLLIIFGPYVRLDGYPPWQLRLTEIFCVGDAAGTARRVEYQGFLRALWRFAGAEMRFGT